MRRGLRWSFGLLAPLLLLVAVSIKFDSPGSVLFRQRRYGLDGEIIDVYKFRTMTVTEDGQEIRQATEDDERVTRVGRVLRRYSTPSPRCSLIR